MRLVLSLLNSDLTSSVSALISEKEKSILCGLIQHEERNIGHSLDMCTLLKGQVIRQEFLSKFDNPQDTHLDESVTKFANNVPRVSFEVLRMSIGASREHERQTARLL